MTHRETLQPDRKGRTSREVGEIKTLHVSTRGTKIQNHHSAQTAPREVLNAVQTMVLFTARTN